MDQTLGRLILYLMGDATSYMRMLRIANAEVHNFTRSTNAAAMAASVSLAVGLVKPLVSFSKAASDTANHFNLEMSRITGLIGVARNVVEQWKEQLLEIGPAVGRTATELSKAMFFITAGGFRGKDAMDVLTASARAAEAGLGDVKTVAFATSSAVNAYTKMGLTAAQATDILAATVREGKVEASSLAPVLGKLLPIASAMKVDFYEVGGALANLTKVGMSASEASIALTSIMTELARPSLRAEKALQGVGLSSQMLRNMIQSPGGLIAALRLIEEKLDLPDTTGEITKMFGNLRSLRGSLSILAQDASRVDKVMRGLRNSAGAVNKAFEAHAEQGAVRLDMLYSQLHSTMIKVGSAIMKKLIPAIDAAREALGNFNNLWDTLGRSETLNSFVTIAQDKINGIWDGVKEIAIEVWNDTLKALNLDWDKFIKGLKDTINVFKAVINAINVQEVVKWIKDLVFSIREFINVNKQVIQSVLATIAVATALYTTFHILSTSIGILIGVITTLQIHTLLSTAAWIVWKSVIIASMATILIFQASLFVTNAAIALLSTTVGTARVVLLATNITIALCTAATWLWNAAVFALNTRLVAWQGIIMSSRVVMLTWATISAACRISVVLWNAAILSMNIQFAIWKSLIAVHGAIIMLWVGVAAIANASTWAWNTALSIATTVLSSATLALTLHTFATFVSTSATWLLNAALTVMNALLAPAYLLAAAATLGIIAGALLLASASGYAAYESIAGMIDVLGTLPTTFGPIAHVKKLFGEWIPIIKDIIHAARNDLPLAWQLITKGFQLAISQISDMWPPLWKFIQSGFEILWDQVSNQFQLAFMKAVVAILQKIAPLVLKVFGIDADETIKDLNKSIETTATLAKERLKQAAKEFNVIDSDKTKKLREELDKLRANVKKGVGNIGDAWVEKNEIADKGREDGNTYVDAVRREINSIDATLLRSAESMARIRKFAALIRGEDTTTKESNRTTRVGRGGITPPTIIFNPGAQNAIMPNTIGEKLDNIHNELKQQRKDREGKGVNVLPMNLKK